MLIDLTLFCIQISRCFLPPRWIYVAICLLEMGISNLNWGTGTVKHVFEMMAVVCPALLSSPCLLLLMMIRWPPPLLVASLSNVFAKLLFALHLTFVQFFKKIVPHITFYHCSSRCASLGGRPATSSPPSAEQSALLLPLFGKECTIHVKLAPDNNVILHSSQVVIGFLWKQGNFF